MGDVLVYIEPSGEAADNILAFAKPLAAAAGGDLIALTTNAQPSDPNALAAADIILNVSHPALFPYSPEAHGAALEAAIAAREPALVVLANTTAGLDLGPAAALATARPFVGYCLSVALEAGDLLATSELYGGHLLASIRAPLPAVCAINSRATRGQSAAAGRGERVELSSADGLDRIRTVFVEHVVPPDGDADITRADRLVCIGRGIGSAENISSAAALASALEAELAATRPIVDAGWMTKTRQVGKSGVTVRPKLYLALGVSGAPEHIEGMEESELIIAVNTDPSAAIFNAAHYGAVADLLDVADELARIVCES